MSAMLTEAERDELFDILCTYYGGRSEAEAAMDFAADAGLTRSSATRALMRIAKVYDDQSLDAGVSGDTESANIAACDALRIRKLAKRLAEHVRR